MNFSVYDKKLRLVTQIGETKSVYWEEGYSSEGTFTIELPAGVVAKTMLKTDYYIKRFDRRCLMVIKSVQLNDNTVVVMGKSATVLLKDVAFIGTIQKNSNITQALFSAYNQTSKPFDNVSVVQSNLTDTYDAEISNKSMYELHEIMCQSKDIGFSAVIIGENIEITTYKPTENPNLIFAKEYGNVASQSISFSTENYKNYAIVLGDEDDQGNIERVDVDLSNGKTRREIIVNGVSKNQEDSNETYAERLYGNGLEELLNHMEVNFVDFIPPTSLFGSIYDIGDILTVILNDFDSKIKARVIRYTYQERNGKADMSIGVGSPIIRRYKK